MSFGGRVCSGFHSIRSQERGTVTDLSTEDGIQLIHGNALQLLGVVKATYSDVTFEDLSYHDNCSAASSDIEALQCKWKTAAQLTGSGDSAAEGFETFDARMGALVEVDLDRPIRSFSPLN